MTVTATIENVTIPGDAIHWGDTIRVLTGGMPSGRNYASIKTFGSVPPGFPSSSFYADRKVFRGDATGDEVLFTIGASSAENPINNGVFPPGAEGVQCYMWLDNDGDLSNGRPPGGDLAPFVVLPPR